jgi:hypothetical protein
VCLSSHLSLYHVLSLCHSLSTVGVLVLLISHGKKHRSGKVRACLGETETKNTINTVEIGRVAVSDHACWEREGRGGEREPDNVSMVHTYLYTIMTKHDRIRNTCECVCVCVCVCVHACLKNPAPSQTQIAVNCSLLFYFVSSTPLPLNHLRRK